MDDKTDPHTTTSAEPGRAASFTAQKSRQIVFNTTLWASYKKEIGSFEIHGSAVLTAGTAKICSAHLSVILHPNGYRLFRVGNVL